MSIDAPPLTPDADTARRWAVEELAKDEYGQGGTSVLDRVLGWLLDLVDGIGNGIGGDAGTVGTTITAAVVAGLVALVLWLVVGPMRRSRARAKDAGLFEDDRSAAELETGARAAARAGDWQKATLDLYRALILRLAERDLVSLTAGLTAAEAAAEAALNLPALAGRLAVDADAFDGIRYGHVAASESTYAHVSGTLDACLSARPRLADAAATP
ncbi:DUF4129 domain-containing protein [Demequina iriomotensis]|uniref:DUF4129 domain-containing protein n=1 Tax=Demequina iriomotensis TaxID=1536641 RepID=UPI0007850984|nr:DUF4129 domain-containing protein [Demequina iriomotensis]